MNGSAANFSSIRCEVLVVRTATNATNTRASMRDACAHGESMQRMQTICVQHARKTSQNARAHTVLQKNLQKDARAHTGNEWKGPPPVEGEKKGEREEGKRKKERRKRKKDKSYKQTNLTTKKKKQPTLTKTRLES